ncbi:hypothetical protein ASF58_16045 [Methylobacterium sp. Leaf125]|uniref:GntR family transcriptional regulator n=1 Tax=Methylobacterium sp. Leaf125 TaxID=1736265 RepID=UPI0006FD1C0E|nr:GntR family transcriptional regulator [Methylobacterium sp. Leaf125]KQQ24950.1 hypothetical protein ASF58_16045 [Methylobacterium sp. Leaf125]
MDRPAEPARPAPPADAIPLSRRVPFARQIADTLRDLIVRGDLAAGSRIVERTLCERLSVSRTPLREALKLLEADGLIELSQNRGARVMSMTIAEAGHLFELIAGLEGFAAELAVARACPDDIIALDLQHAQMLRHYADQEKDAYFALNNAIHDAVVRLSGNPLLIATHASILLRARRGRYMAIVDPLRWRESVAEHAALMAAFRSCDAPAAGAVWRQHLRRTGETVRTALGQPAVSADGASEQHSAETCLTGSETHRPSSD